MGHALIPSAIGKECRLLFLRAKRAVATLLGGKHHSVFKGAGVSFEEVRPYQVGDDIRSIDWNVTARMGQPFLKRYVEERELQVLLLVDISPSMQFGTTAWTKRMVANDIGAVIAYITLQQNDLLGLLLFGDRVEHVVQPRKGIRHTHRILLDLNAKRSNGPHTNVNDALTFVQRVWRKRGLIILITDLIAVPNASLLHGLAQRQDCIVVQISDQREREWPQQRGVYWIQDMESGLSRPVTWRRAQSELSVRAQEKQKKWLTQGNQGVLEIVSLDTSGVHLESFLRYLRLRQLVNRPTSR